MESSKFNYLWKTIETEQVKKIFFFVAWDVTVCKLKIFRSKNFFNEFFRKFKEETKEARKTSQSFFNSNQKIVFCKTNQEK